MTRRPWTFRAAAIGVAFAAASTTLSVYAVAQADSPARPANVDRHDPQPAKGMAEHNLEGPLSKTQAAQRQEALNQVISGEKTVKDRGGSKVVELESRKGDSKYVELGREKTDKIFTILVEFGDKVDSRYGGTAGPLHNQIAEPDRAKDNSTAWKSDYNKAHFQDLYFGTGTDSMKTYYEKQSSGRYSVDGEVSDWVKVPYNEARYGSNKCDPDNCAWYAVQDGVTAWVADQKAAGKTDAEIKAQLAGYDQWDRYDHDGDGDFNESDGYIDHFQIVHAGEDESAGGGAQGEDAIWAHRWYAFGTDAGATGPEGNRLGGTQIGESGIWVGDYTVQPENGGIGVFAHEFGHDLGLPDHYDTAGGSNGVNWWSIMGQSRANDSGEAIGSRANEFSAWDQLQLGWLDYEVAVAGQERVFELGPHEYNTAKAQGLVVVLPDISKSFDYGAPFAGNKMWWSEKGNDLDHSMTAPLDLTGRTTASLSLKARYDIEADYDYLYVEASNEDGSWVQLDGVANGAPFVRDSGNSPAISGSSGGQWVDVQVPLDSFAGKKTKLRLAYRTDGALAPQGFFADAISVVADGVPVLTDGGETAGLWTTRGFRTTEGKETKTFDQFYIASNRTYQSYGKYNRTGPYRFSFPDKPDLVEHFPYQDGLLVSLWNTSYLDNNVSEHPGEGLILPIDANPAPLYNLEGQRWSTAIGGYDAPFSLQKSDSFTLHVNGKASYVRGQAAQPMFDDTKQYWYAEQPNAGVKLPAVGVGLRVVRQSGTSMTVKLSKTK